MLILKVKIIQNNNINRATSNPQVNVNANEEPRKAYGGADPLENTGAIPRVEVPAEPVAPTTEQPAVETTTPAPEATPEVKAEPTPVAEQPKTEETAKPSEEVETLEF